VPRRVNPERIHKARRAAIRNTLIGSGMDEAVVRCLEPETGRRGLPKDGDYWTAGAEWITAERVAGRPGSA
jgi:hypothetical protein